MPVSDYSHGSKFQRKELPEKAPEKIPITLHEHHAEKAGLHYDLRLGGRGDWAIRYFPVSPGEKRLAIRQPTHPLDYYGFSGEITDGYGKGKVNLKFRGNGEVTSWSSDKIDFSFDGNRYALIKTTGENQWLIIKKGSSMSSMAKESYHRKSDDAEIRKALRLEEFGKALKDMKMGNRIKKISVPSNEKSSNTDSSNLTRAQNEMDHEDVTLNKGNRTRADVDMAQGNIGF